MINIEKHLGELIRYSSPGLFREIFWVNIVWMNFVGDGNYMFHAYFLANIAVVSCQALGSLGSL